MVKLWEFLMNYKMSDFDYQVPDLPNHNQSIIVGLYDEDGDRCFLYVPKSDEFYRENGGSYPYQDDDDDQDQFSISNFPQTSYLKIIPFLETNMYLIFGSLLEHRDTITIFFGFFNCSSESQHKYEVVSRCFFSFSTYCHNLFEDEDEECIIDLGEFSWAIPFKDKIHFVQVTQELLDAFADHESDMYIDIICCGVSFTTKTLDFSSIRPLGRIESHCSIVNCGGEFLIEHEEEDYQSRGSDIFRKLCITIRLLNRDRIFPDWFSYSFIIGRHHPGKDNGDTDDEEARDIISTKISDDIRFSQGPGSGEQ